MRIILIIAMLFTTSAVAQTVDPSQPKSIMNALQELGYRAQFEADSVGDPRIRSTVDGTNYSIWFYGCSDNRDCGSINLSTGFDLTNGTTFEVINEWNRAKLVGSAYLDDERDPYIGYFIEAEGGLPMETFRKVISRWEIAIASFKEHINF